MDEGAPRAPSALEGRPVFDAVRGPRTLAAIDAILEGQTWTAPKNSGAFFLAFPSASPWRLPTKGWHIDANYLSALVPPAGLRMHALFGDVGPRSGATLLVGGSHRAAHEWFKRYPPPPHARAAELRRLLRQHPYFRDLHAEGDDEARVARFMRHEEHVDGIALRVIENTGSAGDVILVHPLVLHVASANTGREPRFLLSGGVDTPEMYGNDE